MCVKERHRLHAALSHSSLRKRRGNYNRKTGRVFINNKEEIFFYLAILTCISSHSNSKSCILFLCNQVLTLQVQLLCGDISDSLSGI